MSSGGVLTPREVAAVRAGIAACEDITYGAANDQESADILKEMLARLAPEPVWKRMEKHHHDSLGRDTD